MQIKYSQQLQRLICLLYALNELRGAPTKQEVLRFIRDERLLDLSEEDRIPYLTQTEERWKTDIAYRRKDGVEWDLLFRSERNSWELTRDGRHFLERACELIRDRQFRVTECYLWSQRFKSILDPSYVPGSREAKRPLSRAARRRCLEEFFV